MLDEMRKNPDLLNEYEKTFDNEEKISHALKLDSSSFVLKFGEVNFDELSFAEPLKKGRKETYLGLTTSVKELGIVTPVHVMLTEGYSDWLDSDKSSEFEGFKYIVIDGFRRIYAGVKSGLNSCKAIIWEFRDKDLGSQLLTSLSMLLNKSQNHSWSEVWYLFKMLELQTSMSPATLEYLLCLESGDAMKLKDIMLSDYSEVKDELLSNKKTLTQCYNMLQKLRKEEDQLMIDDTKGISEVEDAKDIIDKEDKGSLSDEETKELLDMLDDFSGNLSEDDFDELAGNDIEADRFDPHGDRHLDPKLRAAVLSRDEYQCQVTGFGKGLPTDVALSVLQIHHIIPVSNGGTNDMNNLITLSQDPHTLLHVIQRRGGRLGMSKEEFDGLDASMQDYLKKVMRLARVAVESDRRLGKTREQIKKDTSENMRYKMPGLLQKENMDAVSSDGGVYNYREATKEE